MKDKKRWLAALLAAAMIFTLAACGGTGGEPEPSEVPASAEPSPAVDDGSVTVCVCAEPQSLDPTLSRPSDSATVLSHLFEGLMKWADSGDEASPGVNKAQLVCGQAEDYDKAENADGTVTYTFHLRPDAKWSDGKRVAAGDFVYAWQRLADPATGAAYSDLIDCVVNASDIAAGAKEPAELAVQAVDEATFAVTIHDQPYFLELCANPVTFPVRQDVVEADAGQWTYAPETYVSNGMYTLSAWTHGGSIVLAPSEHYYDSDAQVATGITFQLSDDASSILSAFEAGTLDFALGAPAERTVELLEDGTLAAADYLGVYFLSFQTQRAPFDDPRVRQAFTLAVDREKLVETAVRGGQTPAGGYIPSGVADFADSDKDFRAVGGDYYDPAADAYADNRAQARRLLDEAGYPGGAGLPEVEYLYNVGGADSVHQAVAEGLKAMWEDALGVTVTLKGLEWSDFLTARRAGEYSIARNSWSADFNDPMSFLELWTGGENDARYASADYDALIRDAAATPSPTRRVELLHQAEDRLIGQDYALCPLYFYTRTYLLDPELDGVYDTPLGCFFFNAASRD